MINDNRPKDYWETATFLRFGALAGAFVSMMHYFIHAFWSASPERGVFVYSIMQMIIYAFSGALLFGGISYIWKYLTRIK